MFRYKTCGPDEAGAATFLPTFCLLSANFGWYGILHLIHGNKLAPTTLSWFPRRETLDLGTEHDGIFTQGTRLEKLESILLSQLHFKLPSKFKLVSMMSRLAAWTLSTCFKMAAADAEFWACLESYFSG